MFCWLKLTYLNVYGFHCVVAMPLTLLDNKDEFYVKSVIYDPDLLGALFPSGTVGTVPGDKPDKAPLKAIRPSTYNSGRVSNFPITPNKFLYLVAW
ncbi:hypothetical protein NQ317_008955 [Molorchus minor]|uniref:Uncharacterized protein n=1 Tax=Molorchus minor TaxID=1323400 RepID=A0ABQ9K1V0_9CUCU|nr:hypothetical protein NQ317_008955 [Molorchus minor]